MKRPEAVADVAHKPTTIQRPAKTIVRYAQRRLIDIRIGFSFSNRVVAMKLNRVTCLNWRVSKWRTNIYCGIELWHRMRSLSQVHTISAGLSTTNPNMGGIVDP